jgi:cytidylate kinase
MFGEVAYRVVCISAADGAAGEQIAALVADHLGFRLINEQVIARAAQEAGVDAHVVAEVERRKSFVSRLLEQLPASGVVPLSGYVPPLEDPALSDENLRGVIRSAIEEIALRGESVIMAHAAAHALSTRPDALRVFITASPETRAGRYEASHGVDGKEAEKLVARGDSNRADYLKRFYRVPAELPVQYDIVVNTDRLTAERAAELIAQAASS